ncbi:MAG TPA: hypothetical protein VD932_03675 [Aquabacterium sp.]|nr:hypothetical protein [Aquabacterium sp.]
MTWFEQSANQTEAAKEHCRPFIAVDMDFPSGHARLWSGYGDLVIGADTFIGAGALGRVSWPAERDGLDAPRKTFELAGADVNPALVPESDLENSFERLIIEYLGWLNTETGQLVAQPEVSFWLIDSINRFDGLEPRIVVNAEQATKLLDRSSDWRNTHEHQQQFYFGDSGFFYTPSSVLREIVWGGTIVGGGGGGFNGPGGGPGRGGSLSPARRLAL